jgi:flagellar FliL protein
MAAKPPRLEAPNDASAPAGASLKHTAVAFAVAAALAGGLGAAHGLLIGPAPEGSAPGPRKPAEGRSFAPVLDMGTLDLSPVVTNLAAPTDVWVRVEGTLVFEGRTLPHGEALAGQIAGDILAFMRTQTLQQIQGVAGLQHLRQDLNERVATRSQGRVREFIIKSLVVQ